MAEGFVEETLNETEKAFANLLDKKTRKVAKKAVHLYKKATKKHWTDRETQTEDDDVVKTLKTEIITMKNNQLKIDQIQ